MKLKIIHFISIFIIVVFVLASLWRWLTLNWSYSDGERAGYVQKLSQKGWICKTWEGELALVTMPGAIPEKFIFTVNDVQVATRINELAGERVVLQYNQHKFLPSTCFGDTEYFIVNVKKVSEAISPTLRLPNNPER